MKRGSTIIRLLILAGLVIGVLGAYTLMRRSLYIKSIALIPSSKGEVTFVVKDLENGLIPVELMFRTGSTNTDMEYISAMAFNLQIDSKENSAFFVTDQDGNVITKATPNVNLSANSEWEFPINLVEDTSDGVTFNFSAVNKSKSGYASVTPERLVSFYVKGLSSKEDLKLEFAELSVMYSKKRPVTDIWAN